ncbi:glycosyltransferase family 1 protein [Desulfovibrio inopinatus]|uniref:glycosyltransferase family 1 protein n=1 Tax=Desulfovibrio inopinatus TaxID=102109 RepID=UPI0003F54DAB|nr:glycosyltransferase family 1 protein [Desulfovibrio inopinatus]
MHSPIDISSLLNNTSGKFNNIRPRLKPNDQPKYLFISSANAGGNPLEDASTLYRCIFHVLNLRQMGFCADFIGQDEVDTKILRLYDRIIFHRPIFNEQLVSSINFLFNTDKIFCCDFDDMVYDDFHIMSSPRRREATFDKEAILKYSIRNQKALRLFSNVIVSTDKLKALLLRLGNYNIEVIHNGYSELWANRYQAKIEATRKKRINETPKIISYFSGSSSHDADFALIAEQLFDLLTKDKNYILLTVGPLKFENKQVLRGKTVNLGHVPYHRLPWIIGTSWLTLSPLDMTSSFNQCKSGLKFFEAGIFGVPCAASLFADMKRFSPHFFPLTEDPKSLHNAVKALSDKAYYKEFTEKLKRYTMQECNSLIQTKKLLESFDKIEAPSLQQQEVQL